MPRSGAALLYRLATGQFSQRDSLNEFKHRFKLIARSLLQLPATLSWLESFSAQPVLLEFLRLNPRVAGKLQRPYLRQRLSTRSKLRLLQAHYQLELERFGSRPLACLLANGKLQLAALSGKDGEQYTLILTHQHSFDKEGELSLQLISPQAVPLVTLSLSFDQQAQQTAIIIGGLQGPRRSDGNADSIRTATKAFHGLFPKRVVLEAVSLLAQALQFDQVLAVSKADHIYNSWRYRKNFEADYDSFWQTLDAQLNSQGLFELPGPLPRKAMEDIASKKRAEYQRRYALLDDLAAQLSASLL